MAPVPGEGSKRLGAVPTADGEVELRVWAPIVRSLAVDLADGRHELERDGEYWEATVPARPGDEYLLSDRLHRDGLRVGRDAGTCTVVTTEGDAVCDIVLVLPAGQILVHGLLPATAHEFPLAVTGGTSRRQECCRAKMLRGLVTRLRRSCTS